jgi:hypothetical protein
VLKILCKQAKASGTFIYHLRIFGSIPLEQFYREAIAEVKMEGKIFEPLSKTVERENRRKLFSWNNLPTKQNIRRNHRAQQKGQFTLANYF